MIVVRIDLVSAVHPSRSKELGRMYIANDATGDGYRSSYDVAVCRRGTTTIPTPLDQLGPQPTRCGRVEDYPRESYNVWRLITRALLSAFPEEAPKLSRRRLPVIEIGMCGECVHFDHAECAHPTQPHRYAADAAVKCGQTPPKWCPLRSRS